LRLQEEKRKIKLVLTYCLDLFPISREFLANILDAIQNENYSKIKLTMPVPAVGAGYIPAFGGDVTINYALYGMQLECRHVQPGFDVVERNVCNTLLSLSGYCTGNA
jgi:hypothetical protein